jgi:hypothetical protein
MPRDAMALSVAIRPYCPPMVNFWRDILMTTLAKIDPALSHSSVNVERDPAPPGAILRGSRRRLAACLQLPVVEDRQASR